MLAGVGSLLTSAGGGSLFQPNLSSLLGGGEEQAGTATAISASGAPFTSASVYFGQGDPKTYLIIGGIALVVLYFLKR